MPETNTWSHHNTISLIQQLWNDDPYVSGQAIQYIRHLVQGGTLPPRDHKALATILTAWEDFTHGD